MPGDRCIGVAFLWAMFLWPHKERWLARPEASERRQGCRAPKERALEVQNRWMRSHSAVENRKRDELIFSCVRNLVEALCKFANGWRRLLRQSS